MKIYAPNKQATGTWCSVRFVNGVGETNDPHLIKWFKEHGYKLEEVPTTKVVTETILNEVVETTDDFESMTPNQLREWMKSNGYGSKIKNIRDKEKLIKIVRGE